jgi:serine/threonine protein kinase
MMNAGNYLFQYNDFNLMINPNEYGITMKPPAMPIEILAKYQDAEDLYCAMMSPTKIKVAFDKNKNNQVAVKTIYKNLLFDDLAKKQASIEFPIQCSLNHPNLVEGYEYGENENEFVGVLEYVNRPEYLKERIDEDLNQIAKETKLKSFMADLLEGIDYLHDKGIVHADIKIENILTQKEEGTRLPTLKICDFGLIQLLQPDTNSVYVEKVMGTHGYIAPELKANHDITSAVDMWSLGVVLYKFCVAYKPTQMGGYQYGSGPIPFRKIDWRKRSPELIDLVKRMLEFDPNHRITAREALDHQWFHWDNFN